MSWVIVSGRSGEKRGRKGRSKLFHELKEKLAVGRKGVGYLAAPVLFIEKTGSHKTMGVLGNVLEVATELLRDPLDRNAFVPLDEQHDRNTPMVRRPLKISVNVFWGFFFFIFFFFFLPLPPPPTNFQNF